MAHTFWSRLAHEPSTIGIAGKPAPFSELAYHFLREFLTRANAAGPGPDKVVLAVPGSYLKDPATEEEKIGLLLGMAGELKLPLAGVVDLACAALCDSRAPGFQIGHSIVVLDLHLDGADVTLLGANERLERRDFIHLPQSGYAQLLKHLTGTMGNRFLRHTAFDILEDGRIEQTFFRQTKEFLLGELPEHRFQINTSNRTYEMLAKREQLVADAQTFAQTLAQSVQTFVHNSPHASEPCTVALTERTGHVPGLEARLRAVGLHRIIRLPVGAAACGAARLGTARLSVPPDIGDVAVQSHVPLDLVRRAATAAWEARLQKLRTNGPRPAPTHIIVDGIGHAIAGGRFTIGTASTGVDVPLPETFNAVDPCRIPLLREGGRVWFLDDQAGTAPSNPAARTAIEAGDRLLIRCGPAATDVLFAHCNSTNGSHSA